MDADEIQFLPNSTEQEFFVALYFKQIWMTDQKSI